MARVASMAIFWPTRRVIVKPQRIAIRISGTNALAQLDPRRWPR